MAWIKFEKDLLTDPRVVRIARALQTQWVLDTQNEPNQGVEYGNAFALPAVTLVCGALIRIWSLADTHLDADDILPLGIAELDEIIGLPICELLPTDWLTVIDENTVKLPGFHEHNGTEAKKKAVTQKRVARFRARNAAPLPPVTHDRVLLDQTRLDQTIPKEKDKRSPSGSRLQIEALPEDWENYASKERPELDAKRVFQDFRDYWIAVPGSKGRKLDWLSTWRKWVRNQGGNGNGKSKFSAIQYNAQQLAKSMDAGAISKTVSDVHGEVQPLLPRSRDD